jgi:phytoene synthase
VEPLTVRTLDSFLRRFPGNHPSQRGPRPAVASGAPEMSETRSACTPIRCVGEDRRVTDADLARAYERCRELHRRFGRSYYLATKLLPAWKRRHVHALYGFARYADEIVDSFTLDGDRGVALEAFAGAFFAGLDGAEVDDPVLPAVLHTIKVFGLPHRDFQAFLRSMRMDLTVSGYASYDDLLGYMEGSAAAIGAMMVPLLGTPHGAAADHPARELGRAFQLTNFIRDVAEDLRRGRIYLPTQDLEAFGVTPRSLRAAAAQGESSPEVKALIAFEVERAHRHYAAAVPGITLLEPASQVCIRTAYELYRAILLEIARADYEVFNKRVRVSRARRMAVMARCVATATRRR